MEEVNLGKQRLESIVPLPDRGSRAFQLFLWRQPRGGLDCLLGDVFSRRQAKQKIGLTERKAVLSWCVYAPQVPEPKEDLIL